MSVIQSDSHTVIHFPPLTKAESQLTKEETRRTGRRKRDQSTCGRWYRCSLTIMCFHGSLVFPPHSITLWKVQPGTRFTMKLKPDGCKLRAEHAAMEISRVLCYSFILHNQSSHPESTMKSNYLKKQQMKVSQRGLTVMNRGSGGGYKKALKEGQSATPTVCFWET